MLNQYTDGSKHGLDLNEKKLTKGGSLVELELK